MILLIISVTGDINYCIENIDIEPVKYLTNLETLKIKLVPLLTENELDGVLDNLTNLKELSLKSCNIGDLEFLRNLDLESLAIGNYWMGDEDSDGNGFIDIYHIEGNNHFTDLDPISNMTNLKYLDLDCMKNIYDLNALKNLTNLECIKFTHGNLRDATALENTKIRTNSLDFYDEEFSEFGFQYIEDTFKIKDDNIICIPTIIAQALDENSKIYTEENNMICIKEVELSGCEWVEYGETIKINSDESVDIIIDKVLDPEAYGANGIFDIRYHINLIDKEELIGEINSIKIKQWPNTKQYKGEEIDLSNGIITAEYESGQTVDICMNDPEVIVEGYDKNQIGPQDITLCYADKTIEIQVIVEVHEHEHTWDEGTVTKEATCAEEGIIKYTCTVCEETKEEKISALGHEYNNDECIRCGEKIFAENSKYATNETILTGIKPNTIISEFLNNIRARFDVSIIQDYEIITEGQIGTGMRVQIKENENLIGNYFAIVIGDCDGDGESNIKDMVKINNYRLYGTTNNFDEIYQKASDVNKDGKIDIKDMVRINNYRLYGTEF